MDDRRIAAEFFVVIDVEFLKKRLPCIGPVGESIERAPVAKDHGGLMAGERDCFELSLDVKNGALRGAAAGERFRPGKSAAENNAGRFGCNGNVPAEIAAGHFEHGRLSAAGSAGENSHLRFAADLTNHTGRSASPQASYLSDSPNIHTFPGNPHVALAFSPFVRLI